MKNNTLSSTILKLLGKYEGKLEKESQEIIQAKIEYDRVSDRVKELRLELDEINDRICNLKVDQRTYESELKRREQLIMQQMNDEVSAQYRSLEEERERLESQLVEVQEAIRAGSRVKSTARSVMQHLESAESWATYDVWFKGGIISHMSKYNHIDNAESDFNRLSSQLKDFKKELSDIDIPEIPGIGGIDSTTRVLDFWFDNIFTDLRVRDQILNDSEQIRKIYGNVDRAISKLRAEVRNPSDTDVLNTKE